jgi:hypothetical protein
VDGDHLQSTYDRPHNEFICESIQPLEGFDTAAMSIGEPGFPKRFKWRDREYELGEIVERWKESGPCRNGANERYLRKHWYRVVTTDGTEMKIYFDRQVRSKSQRTKRWWLYTVKGSSAES